jgi:hypothetical protein
MGVRAAVGASSMISRNVLAALIPPLWTGVIFIVRLCTFSGGWHNESHHRKWRNSLWLFLRRKKRKKQEGRFGAA